MQKYLTYAEYQELGGTLEEANFDKFLMPNQLVIDNYTNQKLVYGDFETMPELTKEKVKLCLTQLIDYSSNFKNTEYSSMSNSGVSVSYKDTATRQNDEASLIYTYLDGAKDNKNIGLLYRG